MGFKFLILPFVLLLLPAFVAAEPCSDGLEALARKAENVLVGTAIGDSFGVGLEGVDRAWLEANIDFTRYISLRRGKYALGYRLGNYSDDTADSIAWIRLLLSDEGASPDTIVRFIRAEYEADKAAQGGIPRSGYGSIQHYFTGRKSLAEVRAFQTRAYPGNAPPMRAAILGLISNPQRVDELAILNADATHPHPKARVASLMIARASHFLVLQGGRSDQLFGEVLRGVGEMDAESLEYFRKVDSFISRLSRDDYLFLLGPQPMTAFNNSIEGLPPDAMRTAGAALYILKHAKSPFDALRRSILVGGDVDTLAAITVGIMSGKLGRATLPPFLEASLERRSQLIDLSSQYARWLWDQSSAKQK